MNRGTNQINITKEDIQEAEKLELDVQTIMRLIDLIFLCKDESKEIPSNITDEMRMDIENKMSRSDYMKKYNVSLSTYYNHKNAILK